MKRVSTSSHPVSQRQLHDMKVWDLGFTKNHPPEDVAHSPADLRTIAGAPGIMKAGVEPDIYIQAIHLLGPDYPAMVANYAVAAQVLRTKLATTPRWLWESRGLRQDVLDRFVNMTGAHGLSDFDLHYLIQLLEGAMATWDAGPQSVYGNRELSVPLRVGRLAAAYRQRLPFTNEPCLASGAYDPVHAGMGGVDRRPLCFDDATDRAVHAWYAMTLIRELASAGVPERMAAPLRASRQGWIGIRRPGTFKAATRQEVVEAKVAGQLLGEGAMSYGDTYDVTRRALRLACRQEEL